MRRKKRYKTILIDPPWAFETYGKHHTTPHRSAHDHYGVMSFDELRRLPIRRLADKDCALFMWVVDSHFPEALKLAKSWGFEFKTCAFIWVKTAADGSPRIGMGYWSRKMTEQVWLFTRGSPRRIGKGVRQIIEAPRREHSRKPDEIYERIQELVGGPCCEVFARQRYPGFDQALGDQSDLMDVGRIARPPPVTGPLLDIMLANETLQAAAE